MKNQRLLALFILGWILFNYPIMSVFDRHADAFGIPVLYVYLFATWGLVIALLIWIIEYQRNKTP